MYDVLEGLAKSLVGLGGGGRARYTVLRLTDVLGLSEERGEAPVDLYERASRPLIPRSAPSREALRGLVHIGVDSSSRALSTPAADVAIAAASVSGPGPVELCDYPSLYPYLSCEGGGEPPFAYVIPHGPLNVLEAPGVTVVSADPSQLSGAFVNGVMDYARLALERWALTGPALLASRAYGSLGRRPVVLLDGPIFIAQGKGVSELMAERYRAVSRLEAEGFPVIGVAKRVERSYLLSGSPRFASLVEGCGVRAQGVTDTMLLQQLASSGCSEVVPGRAYATPKVIVRANGLTKVVEYVLIVPSPWQRPGVRSRVYRLEYSERTLEILREWGLDPLQAFLGDSVSRQSLEPVTVAASDRRAKMITNALKGLLAKSILGLGGRLGYETELEERGAE
ncbi:MAG: DNA double-strand break repair nuclease NurA [Acidilobus sp.]|nr:DNA double-strand break repair nuclease NurA [Acidilobus sp.]